MSIKTYLEQKQVHDAYKMTEQEIADMLALHSDLFFCARVLIERGHDNEEIKQHTGVSQVRLSWMRVRADQPPPKHDLELFYRQINKDYVHVTTMHEREFCRLFQCGIYHKDYQKTLARVDQ